MTSTTATFVAPPLIEYICPVCLKRGGRKILTRAAKGSVVEVYCKQCKFKKVVIIS